MIALWWCRVAMVGLTILQPLWFAWFNSPQVIAPWLVVMITTLPLALLIPVTWPLRARGLVIGGCVLLLYFCLAVMEAWVTPPARVPALAQIVLIGLYFTALPAVRKVPARSD